MKTREQFFKILETTVPTLNKVDSLTCEKIADNHAVDFVKWYQVKCILSSIDYRLTVEQVLEMFKKEKEL